jgi:hypothetical protein
MGFWVVLQAAENATGDLYYPRLNTAVGEAQGMYPML